MNKTIGIYGTNASETDYLTRCAIKNGYKQPIIYTSINDHTPYVKQFHIERADNVEHAQQLLIKKFGSKADFGILAENTDELDPEQVLPGPREIVSSDVVIPYHKDVLQFVPEAVDSIINQSCAHPVIHLISDGISTEQDPIYRAYKDVDCVRTYHNKKSGPYIATNRVFQFLETDYISILDSDDIAMPNRLWKAVTALKISGKDIYGGSMEQFIDQRHTNNKTFGRLERQPIVWAGESEPIIHGAQTSKKSVFEDLNGYGDFFCGADGHFIRRATCAGYSLYCSSHIVAIRRLHNASLTNNDTHGSATKFRRDLQYRMDIDYANMKQGKDPRKLGSLHIYRDSKDICRTN